MKKVFLVLLSLITFFTSKADSSATLYHISTKYNDYLLDGSGEVVYWVPLDNGEIFLNGISGFPDMDSSSGGMILTSSSGRLKTYKDAYQGNVTYVSSMENGHGRVAVTYVSNGNKKTYTFSTNKSDVPGQSESQENSVTNLYASKSTNQSSHNHSSHNHVHKTREDLGYGMFVITEKYPDGRTGKVWWITCSSCRGTTKCGLCYGTGKCSFCNGQGGIVSPGYGNYIPCASCNRTGKCTLCQGTANCFCTKYDYPGYMISSTIVMDENGQIIYNSRDFDIGSSSSSSSSKSSSSSSRSVCSKCGGAGYDSQSYIHAAASTSGWLQPHHNTVGTKCKFCGSSSDHYHYPCTECHGYGRVRK